MKAKAVAILFAIACIALLGALWYRSSRSREQAQRDLAAIGELSNQWKQVTTKLDDSRTVNLALEHELSSRVEALKSVSNSLANTSATLAATTADLAKAQTEAKAAQDAAESAMKARDEKISKLEGERDDLTKRMTDLNGSINKLEGQITETERKLKTSEGDREYLIGQLKKLQAEKAELEKKFQDLVILREQVRKLRDELSIAKRLEWIRRGLYGDTLKGAEKLQRGAAAMAPAAVTNKTVPANLNVEINRDGAVKVSPNSPPAPASAVAPKAKP